MIIKVNIDRFGLYNNFSWDTEIGKQETFRRVNIIYGRNYSGKTTLARIFKCIENAILHKDYPDCGFSMTLEDGSILTHDHFNTDLKLRIYNTDFVRENLSWLHNTDGSIRPFTILGAKNVEIDRKVSEINNQLGDMQGKKALLQQSFMLFEQINALKRANDKKKNELDSRLSDKANSSIKINTAFFRPTAQKRTYNIADIKAELAIVEKNIDQFLLAPHLRVKHTQTLVQTAMSDLETFPANIPHFAKYRQQASDLLQKEIRPTQTITDLINDNLLQEWVRNGISLHKDLSACGFCGNSLPANLWEKLDAHFSKESEDLRQRIIQLVETLKTEKKRIEALTTIERDDLYSILQEAFDRWKENWKKSKQIYEANIEALTAALEKREKDIFKTFNLPELTDNSEDMVSLLNSLNELLDTHNKKKATLTTDQESARKALRYDHIAQFFIDIGYTKWQNDITAAESKIALLVNQQQTISQKISALMEEKAALEAMAKDESRGAELVNQHLAHFFGHSELRLIAQGQTPNMKFVIQREGKDASNLSEGECSLISFCYFIARMEDELKDQQNIGKLIIYIDDPISSLDNNHIFFLYSLIESIIAKPQQYGQLFISTHNLEFLKYLKRLTLPRYKPFPDSKTKADVKHFIIERKQKHKTTIRLAPDFLKNYITEFNYLFKKIYECSIAQLATMTEDINYNFGNNMRKFLEAYLFYKYPSHKMAGDTRLEKFFGEDIVSLNCVNRLINEYSHVGEQFDRATEPVDREEIKKVAQIVLERIKHQDADQYHALLESVGIESETE